jgi:hypothetical protein
MTTTALTHTPECPAKRYLTLSMLELYQGKGMSILGQNP